MTFQKTNALSQLRAVDTPAGTMTYFLIRKRVRNLNLRIDRSGQVTVSIPYHASAEQADRMVRGRHDWIAKQRDRLARAPVLPPMPPKEDCLPLLRQAVERVYPRIEPLGVAFPEVKQRAMKSQWGNCHWKQGYITLNTALCRCPEGLRDYVALHELAHFLHPNHGPGFYAVMDALMPDWRARRKGLRSCSAALSE